MRQAVQKGFEALYTLQVTRTASHTHAQINRQSDRDTDILSDGLDRQTVE